MSYIYDHVTLVRVIDGDTVVLKLSKTYNMDIDFGFYIKDQMSLTKSTEMTFRLYGINTPELHGVPIEEAKKGQAAKKALEDKLSSGILRAETFKADKYGRFLVKLYISDLKGEVFCVNDQMVSEGYAVPYLG